MKKYQCMYITVHSYLNFLQHDALKNKSLNPYRLAIQQGESSQHRSYLKKMVLVVVVSHCRASFFPFLCTTLFITRVRLPSNNVLTATKLDLHIHIGLVLVTEGAKGRVGWFKPNDLSQIKINR